MSDGFTSDFPTLLSALHLPTGRAGPSPCLLQRREGPGAGGVAALAPAEGGAQRRMSIEGAAGAPSIDRRAQDTTYHLYSATDGFVPTVRQHSAEPLTRLVVAGCCLRAGEGMRR